VSDPRVQLQAGLAECYVLERELGRGGMATVYLARDLKHKRPVALKVLGPDLSHSLGVERFQREIETAAGLQHPHILPLHDSGEAAGLLWYTMPYVEGESLRDRLTREPQLPLEQALRIAREVADALAYAHERGVVHRDVKPENILLSGGHALVADFGVAKALDQASGGHLTEAGMAVGTPQYMAPEQAGGGPVDARADVYALGCVLFEMLAGEPPFTGRTPQAVIAKRILEPVPHVRTLRESVSEDVERALTRALAKVPADRFPTAAEFARALSDAAPTMAVSAATAAAPQAVPAGGTRRWGPRRAVALGLAALLALGAGAAALLWRSRTAATAFDADLLAVAPFDVLDPSSSSGARAWSTSSRETWTAPDRSARCRPRP
jgi:eukaryotic-like serine/threonine-protein kinase